MNKLKKFIPNTVKAFVSVMLMIYASVGYSSDIHWQELPESETFFTMMSVDESFNDLQLYLDTYHAIKKDDLKLLDYRIGMLGKIISECDKLIVKGYESKYTQLSIVALRKISMSKKNYLAQIGKLYDFFDDDFNSVKHLFAREYYPRSEMSLELKNSTFFSPHMESEMGFFWVEMLDPCHRPLYIYWKKWQKLGIKTPFFLWLEDEVVDRNISRTNIISAHELDKYKIKIKSGRIHTVNSSIGMQIVNESTEDREYLFIINLNDELLICEAKSGNRHVSISGGRPVLAAGNLWIKDGMLTKIFFRSGHYLPTLKNYKFTYRFLQDLGVNMTQIKTVDYYLDTTIVSQSLDEFKEFIIS